MEKNKKKNRREQIQRIHSLKNANSVISYRGLMESQVNCHSPQNISGAFQQNSVSGWGLV